MNIHEKINYVEFPASNIPATKSFFSNCFGWVFTDYGSEYTAFNDEGLDGGFYQTGPASTPVKGGALLVFYSNDLETTLQKVQDAGGTIAKKIFSFPGGRRFHFYEPSGNELAVWSDR